MEDRKVKYPKIDKTLITLNILSEPDIFRREYPKKVLENEYIGQVFEKKHQL